MSGTGSGLTVASVQFDGWNSADLTNYASAAGLTLAPGQMTSISVDGAAVSGPDQEDSLDAETLLAMAPAAKQLMYIAPNTTAGLVDVYAQIANEVATRPHRRGQHLLGVLRGQLGRRSQPPGQPGELVERHRGRGGDAVRRHG